MTVEQLAARTFMIKCYGIDPGFFSQDEITQIINLLIIIRNGKKE
jgi:hypothetical protein